jgi:hypothetical protein
MLDIVTTLTGPSTPAGQRHDRSHPAASRKTFDQPIDISQRSISY